MVPADWLWMPFLGFIEVLNLLFDLFFMWFWFSSLVSFWEMLCAKRNLPHLSNEYFAAEQHRKWIYLVNLFPSTFHDIFVKFILFIKGTEEHIWRLENSKNCIQMVQKGRGKYVLAQIQLCFLLVILRHGLISYRTEFNKEWDFCSSYWQHLHCPLYCVKNQYCFVSSSSILFLEFL